MRSFNIVIILLSAWSLMLHSMNQMSLKEKESLEKVIDTLDDIIEKRASVCDLRAKSVPPNINPYLAYDACIRNDKLFEEFNNLYTQAKDLLNKDARC